MKEIPITSFDNLQIGQAENTAAGTGCTVVLLGKDGAPAGLDVRAYNVLHHNFVAAKAGTPQLLLIQKNG